MASPLGLLGSETLIYTCRSDFFLLSIHSENPPEEAFSLTPLLPRALFHVAGLIFVVLVLGRSSESRSFQAKGGPHCPYLTGLGSASSSGEPGQAKRRAARSRLVAEEPAGSAGSPVFPNLGRGPFLFRIVFWELQYPDFRSRLFRNRRVA